MVLLCLFPTREKGESCSYWLWNLIPLKSPSYTYIISIFFLQLFLVPCVVVPCECVLKRSFSQPGVPACLHFPSSPVSLSLGCSERGGLWSHSSSLSLYTHTHTGEHLFNRPCASYPACLHKNSSMMPASLFILKTGEDNPSPETTKGNISEGEICNVSMYVISIKRKRGKNLFTFLLLFCFQKNASGRGKWPPPSLHLWGRRGE